LAALVFLLLSQLQFTRVLVPRKKKAESSEGDLEETMFALRIAAV
jgi:hypothetical protein